MIFYLIKLSYEAVSLRRRLELKEFLENIFSLRESVKNDVEEFFSTVLMVADKLNRETFKEFFLAIKSLRLRCREILSELKKLEKEIDEALNTSDEDRKKELYERLMGVQKELISIRMRIIASARVIDFHYATNLLLYLSINGRCF